MPKFQKISADEAMSRRKDHLLSTDRGDAVAKAVKAPPSWDKDARSARFVMTTQQEDRYGDIVVTSGGDLTEFLRNPVGLLFHNSRTWPVATWQNVETRLQGRPPRIEGDFALLPAGGPVKEIDETEWMIANGGIRACSIGFIPDWDEVEMVLDDEGKPTWGYRFNKWEMIECSVCAIPANPGALAKSAGGDQRLAKELLEDVLDNWVRSPEGLLLSREDFEKAYKVTVEKISADRRTPSGDTEWPEIKALPAGVSESDFTKLTGAQMQQLREIAKTQGKDAADAALAEAIRGSAAEEDSAPMDDEDEESGEESAAEESSEDDAKKAVSTVTIKIDTKEAEGEISRLSGLVDGLAARIAKIFGRVAPEERVEPHMDLPTAPDAEAIAAAKAKAAEVLKRASALI